MQNHHEFFNKRLSLKKEILTQEGKSYNQIKKDKANIELSEIDELIGDTDPTVSSVDLMYEYQKENGEHFSDLRKAIENALKEKHSGDDALFEKVKKELDTLAQKESLIEKKRFSLRRKNIGTSLDDEALKRLDMAEALIQQREGQIKGNRETTNITRAVELLKYKEEFKKGYIETPSRKKAKKQIAELIASGEHVFLEGDSGTGKTQLLRHLVRDLEGYEPDVVVSSDQTKLTELLGRDKLESDNGGTITVFKEGMLVRAMTSGKKIIFDEFNNMDSNVRFALKPFYTLKPGDTFRLQQDGEREFTVKEGFGFLATGNLPSPKHPERKPLDPAETREFRMPHLEHMPKEEVYDILLVSSMREDGSLPLTREEAEGDLVRLTMAIKDVHEAYEGNGEFYKDPIKKTKAVLQKAVLDPKEYISWVSSYKNQTKLSFAEFLRDKISFFINKGDFPDTDKNLLFKIFATKGFLNGVNLKEFIVDNKEAEALGWKNSLEIKKPEKRDLSLKEASLLDPFGARQISENEAIEEFILQNQTSSSKEIIKNFKEKIGTLTPEQKQKFTQDLDIFWKDTWKTWNSGVDTSKITFTPEWTPQGEIDFKKFAEMSDDSNEFGKYITNPETALLDYESLGIPEVFNPNTDQKYKNWLGQENRQNTVNSVMDYIHETFANTHYLPGIEYQKYLFENQSKIPEALKDGNWHYFPGSAFRNSSGLWSVPYGHWSDGKWDRNGLVVRDDWDDNERVVLFGK